MLGTMREAGLAKSPDVRASGAVLNASCIEFVTEAALKRGPCVDDHPIGWLVETERGWWWWPWRELGGRRTRE